MKQSNNKITVLLCEDHKIVRKGLRALLLYEDDIVVVGEAEDGLEAIRLAKFHQPMVVMMDLALPKLNGMEAAKEILKFNPEIKIIAVTAHTEDGYIEKALAAGISGYVIKQCSPTSLVESLREIRKGNEFYSPSILERINFFKSKDLKKKTEKSKSSELSFREAQVLQLIAEGKANKQIAIELHISIKTVEKHRQSLMNKLSIHDTAGLTRYAISENIIENVLPLEKK